MRVDTVWIIDSVDTQLPLTFARNLVPGLETGLLTGKILTVYITLFFEHQFFSIETITC
jgi:hypothetical protein